MKKVIIIIIFFLSLSINLFCQLQYFYVESNQTDVNYAPQDSNLIIRNTSTQINKLFLFLGGTYSSPKHYRFICSVAANFGYDAISLSYPNYVPVYPLGNSSDSLVFDKFRQEVCFGTPQSSHIVADTLNSIYTRTLKLIQYLSVTYPSQNWGQYLLSPTTLDWSKIAVSGHSQGSGHAAYLAKYFLVERNVMFSGPNDYSSYYNCSAHWLRQAGVTPRNKQFVFLHLQDELVPFEHQFINILGLGMLQTDDTTNVDIVLPPYLNSHCLYSNYEPIFNENYHNSTCIGIYTPINSGDIVFLPVWQYMLTTSVSTEITNSHTEIPKIQIFPNPSTGLFIIEGENIKSIVIFNIRGQTIKQLLTDNYQSSINLSNQPKGVYIIKIVTDKGTTVKKVVSK
ncbi:MAG: T9SS type A sorting domain-containing protein [Candidatus Marinimicrobia bacterium]|nr:T9SS type A sorting domain-containing protein [Candidatus Neomarinimicrobiota bacterium]